VTKINATGVAACIIAEAQPWWAWKSKMKINMIFYWKKKSEL